MAQTFCGVCRHETPGHEPNCPVFTGKPQAGYLSQQNLQDLQQSQQSQQSGLQHPMNMLQQFAGIGQGPIPQEDGYEVARIYREARGRLLEELQMQVEVNHQLGRELIDLRLENQELKKTIEEQHKAITEMSQPRHRMDDEPPF